ncbi:M13 family metallopeptidase [Cognatiluteimonas telluris]|uniref:M13 family metallopeptidase n=1 Tax=Cognatiluteimonas telluris TaxID=1104775 RepID=UPI001409646C|nr:M13 family metallopeptidase [Lysobacter telluris]
MTTPIFRPLALAAALALCLSGNSAARATGANAATPVFDVADLDAGVSACSDFNGFVNGKWVAANPIPPDRSRWGAFDALAEQSLDAQHVLVDKADAGADAASPGSIEQKIGWLYRSGMDEAAIERAGSAPIQPELAAIDALRTRADVTAWLRTAFARGENPGFDFGAGADFKDATRQIAYAEQGGLGLPTPDYYSDDDKSDIRKAYLDYIARSFELTGVPAVQARAKADAVLGIETRLAKASLSRVELRDPKNRYHFVSVAEADAAMPHFGWAGFFKALDVPVVDGFSLSQPKFFAEFDAMLADVPVAQWRDYFAFHAIDDAAPYLSKPFQEASFGFWGRTLDGQPEQRARWKRVLDAVNHGMGEGLGQLYVREYFPPQAKARAQQLVDNVRNALKARIEHLDWMSAETKAKALAKWSTFLPKIGYPDNWRGWDGLDIRPGDYFANMRAARAFNNRYDLDHIGKPTDRMEWHMTPQTVNAYYSASTNTINFPAAILQPPFFYADGDDAINYGGIGAVIGHEASHGFDDKGSQFDGAGNNVNWWTAADRSAFDERTGRLVSQFDGYAPLAAHPDKHVNGKLTLGENIADLGGLATAYDALQAALVANPDEAASKIDGYTQDQRFFLNWARVWRGTIRDEAQLVRLNTDPHAPAQYRAIAAPSNLPAFAQAFRCKAGDAMVRPGDRRVTIW